MHSPITFELFLEWLVRQDPHLSESERNNSDHQQYSHTSETSGDLGTLQSILCALCRQYRVINTHTHTQSRHTHTHTGYKKGLTSPMLLSLIAMPKKSLSRRLIWSNTSLSRVLPKLCFCECVRQQHQMLHISL